MSVVLHSAPRFASNEGVNDAVSATLGERLIAAREEHGEVLLTVDRAAIADALELLRDRHEYQQLMEIAGVDYPDRALRFEVVYMLLSLTRNHRLLVKVNAAEDTPVPTVTHLWPFAGWLESELFDLYGVIFDGNSDLRRILTDYGFEGHPFRKDFPLTGYVELRYSEEDKRVVYEPVKLAQDLRSFDFMSPWEGADYVLPGDEKAVQTPPPPAAAPATPKTTEKAAETGAGKETNKAAAKKVARPGAPKVKAAKEHGALNPTSSRPDRKPRKK
ncbi:MAG: NADH-quinone oxidoreductase subunit C [Novosphingobium sp.]